MGYSQAVRHQTLNLTFPWFESKYPSHAHYREAILCFFYTFSKITDTIPTLLPTQYRHFQIHYRHQRQKKHLSSIDRCLYYYFITIQRPSLLLPIRSIFPTCCNLVNARSNLFSQQFLVQYHLGYLKLLLKLSLQMVLTFHFALYLFLKQLSYLIYPSHLYRI